MTIETQSTKVVAQGNNSNTIWPYDFIIPASTDVVVTLVNLTTGAETVLTPSQYNITGIGSSLGGNVTYPLSGSPLDTNTDIVIQRVVPYVQETDLTNQGGAYPQDIEDALDYEMMAIQQLNEQMDRAVLFSVADEAVGTLPPAAARANKIFTFDATGAPTAGALPTGSVAISAAMIPVVGAATTDTALNLLGFQTAMFGFLKATSLAAARGTIGFYETFAAAQAATISSSLNFLYLAGYATAGDLGGALYKRVVAAPYQLTSADGAHWRIYEQVLTPHMFGDVSSGNITTALQAAINAAASLGCRRVFIPAGSYYITSQVTYVTSTVVVSTFAPGIEIFGAGMGATIIDNRVAGGGSMLSISHSVNFAFQLGTRIHDLSITNTTAAFNTVGIEFKAVYETYVYNVHIFANRIAVQLTCALGDADALNIMNFDHCRFENGSYGIYSNFAAGVTQPSYVSVTNSFFTGQDASGWYYIGLSGSMKNTAFAAIQGDGIVFVNNGSTNAQFTADACGFENCVRSITINSLSMGMFRNTEIANSVGAFAATYGILINTAQNTVFDGTYVRVSAGFNPYTFINLQPGASSISLRNTFFQSFDATGQVRFLDAGTQNRMFDDSGLISASNGVTNLAMVNGANNNYAIPQDGEFFTITGPTGVFNLTGMTRGWNGRRMYLYNTSGQTLTLTHNSGSSSVGNRILGTAGADTTVSNGSRASLMYASSNWHVISVG